MCESKAWCPLVVLCVGLLASVVTEASGALIAVPGDQPTIQDAVDAAGPGDTIQVAPGDYHERVLVDGAQDGLTIEAADVANPPIIHGTPNASQDGIRVDGLDGLTIRNIHVIGAYNGIRLNGVTGALLTGLYIEDNALGIRVYQGQGNRVEQCTIVHTRVEQGIFVDSSPGVVLSQNSVTDAAHGGIRVLNSPCATLNATQAIDSRGTSGIHLDHCDGARVEGCTASGSYRNGFVVSNSPDLTLVGNTADDNQDVGLRIDGCAPFETVDDVTNGGNAGSGNQQAEIVVVPPSSGSSSSVVCAPVATPTAVLAPSPSPTPSTPTTAGSTPTPTVTVTTAGSTPGPTLTVADSTPTPTVTIAGSTPTTTTGPTANSTPLPTATVAQATATSTPVPSPLATTTTEPVPTASSTPVPADPARCQRAVARAGGAFAKGKVSALKRCEERLLKGKLGPDPGPGARLAYCLADPRTLAKIARSYERLEDRINRECGGLNGICGDADDNLDMQIDLGLPSVCPDIDGAGCTNDLTDCREVSLCVACINDAATDRAMALYYDDLVEAETAVVSRALAKCQQAIGKETVKYLLGRTKAIGKCWHDRFKGKHADQCPRLEAQAYLGRADARRIAKICRVCGGADAACDQEVQVVDPGLQAFGGSGGGDDLALSEIGFATTCPDVTVPANAIHADTPCGGPVATLADAVFCLGCVTDFAVDCADRSGVQSFVPYPSSCNLPLPALPVPTPVQ